MKKENPDLTKGRKPLTPKEKWFQTFAKEAAFTLSPAAFRRSADKAQQIFFAAEQKGIPEKTICARIGEPEKVVQKSDGVERQIWRKPLAVLAVVFLAAYILWWWRSWYYIVYVAHSLTILLGSVLTPRILGFLCGRSYFDTCAVIMRKKERKDHKLSAASTIMLLLFLILDGYVFPYAVLGEVFGGAVQMGCYLVFQLLFFGLIIFLYVNGIRGIRRFNRQGYRLVYLGNGLVHSYLALILCTKGMAEPDLGRSLAGMLVAVVPFAAALLLYRLDSVHTNA